MSNKISPEPLAAGEGDRKEDSADKTATTATAAAATAEEAAKAEEDAKKEAAATAKASKGEFLIELKYPWMHPSEHNVPVSAK